MRMLYKGVIETEPYQFSPANAVIKGLCNCTFFKAEVGMLERKAFRNEKDVLSHGSRKAYMKIPIRMENFD